MAAGKYKGFEVVAPEEIRADKVTIDFLILQQLNRVNFLMTIGTSNIGEKKPMGNVMKGIMLGLRSIESMLSYELCKDKDYIEKSEGYKKTLSYTLNPITDIDCSLNKWYDLLIQKITPHLLPTKKETLHFEA